MPCASACVKSTDVTLRFHSLKFCFVIVRMTEIRRICPIKRRSGVPMRTIASRFEIKLGVQRYVHTLLKGYGVDTKNFGPSDTSTVTFHKNVDTDFLRNEIKLQCSKKSSQPLDIVR